MRIQNLSLMILAGIFVTGCSSSSTNETVTNDQESVAEESKEVEETKEEKSDEPQPVGTSITKNDITYTLESVEFSDGNNMYAMPEEGKNFVRCLIKIENGTDENYEYNPFYGWKMLSPTGAYESVSIEANVGVDNALENGELAPGGYIEGVISFEEPVEGKLVLVAYNGMFSDEVAAEWLVRE